MVCFICETYCDWLQQLRGWYAVRLLERLFCSGAAVVQIVRATPAISLGAKHEENSGWRT